MALRRTVLRPTTWPSCRPRGHLATAADASPPLLCDGGGLTATPYLIVPWMAVPDKEASPQRLGVNGLCASGRLAPHPKMAPDIFFCPRAPNRPTDIKAVRPLACVEKPLLQARRIGAFAPRKTASFRHFSQRPRNTARTRRHLPLWRTTGRSRSGLASAPTW